MNQFENLLQECRDLGWGVEQASTHRFKITPSEGPILWIHAASADYRSYQNARALVRRAKELIELKRQRERGMQRAVNAPAPEVIPPKVINLRRDASVTAMVTQASEVEVMPQPVYKDTGNPVPEEVVRFSEKTREAIDSRRVSIADLALRIGYSKSHLSNLLGNQSPWSTEIVDRLVALMPELIEHVPPSSMLIAPRPLPVSIPKPEPKRIAAPKPEVAAAPPIDPDRTKKLVRFGAELARMSPESRAATTKLLEVALGLGLTADELRSMMTALD